MVKREWFTRYIKIMKNTGKEEHFDGWGQTVNKNRVNIQKVGEQEKGYRGVQEGMIQKIYQNYENDGLGHTGTVNLSEAQVDHFISISDEESCDSACSQLSASTLTTIPVTKSEAA